MRRRAIAGFVARFGYQPSVVVRAAGRVNLLGGHTDYNEGFVLPVAVDRAAWVAAAPLGQPEGHIVALDLEEEAMFPLRAVPPRQGNWADYARAVAWSLGQEGMQLEGMAAVLTSDVPTGAGLSSSAAVEVALACAWQALSGFDLDGKRIALACQRAENEYVGVRCGIMDQMAAVWGRADHALLLDCRLLDVELVPLPALVAIVVVDSGVRRELAASEYNQRRRECEEAVHRLSQHLPGIHTLRDMTAGQLAELQGHLPGVLYRRARHVVTENARVLAAAAALRAGDLAAVGQAMRQSHQSLRDDYQVSSPELDLLAETAWAVPGCYGARLTGAGFGGCVVALVSQGAVTDLCTTISQAYEARFARAPAITVCRAADGVSVVQHTNSAESRDQPMSESMVVVAVFGNEMEAYVAKGRLEVEGITAIMLRDDAGGMCPPLQPATGVRLLVDPEHAARAQEILEQAQE